MNSNLVLDTDSYKASHFLQYPPGSKNLFNYLESRGGRYNKTVFFGLQYLLKEYLSKPVTMKDVEEAEAFFTKHGLPFNKEGWAGIVQDHQGFIPMKIKSVDEGSVVPVGTPLLTAEATDPKYFWVVGWFETMIMRLWYPITVATQSWHLKQTIKKYLSETADDVSGLPFKLHDFGSRGVSSRESAAIGGAAHLVSFQGSDTVAGVLMANEFYEAGMAGFSIPAAEHSTITSWGRENEAAAYENMLNQFAKPGALLAIVSDSYNLWDAVTRIWGDKLKERVLKSEAAAVIIRPDSGEPVQVVNRLLYLLDAQFGSTVNKKGYRVLNKVRVIQGDGCNEATIEAILKSAKLAGFSADNLAFGMGGALLQQVNRDTQRFAYKCSAIQVDDLTVGRDGGQLEWRDVYKDPIDDPGKKSKSGRLGVKLTDGKYEITTADSSENILKTRYINGTLMHTTDFAQIRALADK